jgi:hypothetical protein
LCFTDASFRDANGRRRLNRAAYGVQQRGISGECVTLGNL